MKSFNKAEMKELRSLTSLAYESEMSIELEKLESNFASWKEGSLNTFDLNELIHKYHHGPQRELYKLYVLNTSKPIVVASALARGILNSNQVSGPLYEKISSFLPLFREN